MSSLLAGLDLSTVDLPTAALHTDRLLLRPFRPDDEDAVFAACQDPQILRWISALPEPYTREEARAYVARVAPGGRAEGRALTAAVEADGVLVGSAGLHLRPGRLGPEIGYWITAGARGRGYATEATRALADWAFRHGAARVHLFVDVANAPSQAVARRAGFAREGVVRACIEYRDGRRTDAVLFSRLASD